LRKNNTVGNLALAGYNDIFQHTVITQFEGENIVRLPLTELHPPEFHPFQVKDDDAMHRLVESIKRNGVLEPGIVRPRPNGGYELICGNRRKRGSELAKETTMPVIIRDLDNDSAVITMVDSNLEQRDVLLPSEKAWAYQVKLEALRHQGKKSDKHSVDVLIEQTGESKNQIFRLIRLTELIVSLLDLVDSKKLAFNPAVELSYLTIKEQTVVFDAMQKHEAKPSLSQAQRLKKLSQDSRLNDDDIDNIIAEIKKPPTTKTTSTDKYRNFFPDNYSDKQIDKIIIALLKNWQRSQSNIL